MGNLKTESWESVFHGDLAKKKREDVSNCKQNCWMVGSAKTAMRHPKFAHIPKLKPLFWVIKNKIKVTLGLDIDFNKYIDYNQIYQDKHIVKREFFLHKQSPRTKQKETDIHYDHIGEFFNR